MRVHTLNVNRNIKIKINMYNYIYTINSTIDIWI